MKPRIQALCLTLLGTVLVLKGLFMVIGGAQLAWLGGSWFFALAGLGLLASGTLIALRRPMGVGCYLVVLIGTLVWSLGDSGTDFWPLFSRLGLMGALTVAVLLSVPVLIQGDGNCRRRLSSAAKGLAALTAALLAGVLYVALQPQPIQTALAAHVPTPGGSVGGHAGGNWLHYGRTPSGTRHAPLDQISPENVSSLEVAWTYQTGEIPEGRETHVVTPLHVDGVLYGCTQSSRVFALDADTGREIWRFDPKASRNFAAAAWVTSPSLPRVSARPACARDASSRQPWTRAWWHLTPPPDSHAPTSAKAVK
jgi:quinate dehydrogenase (quinone)